MITLSVPEGKDLIGIYCVINGKLYAKYGECDFKENSTKNWKCRKVIAQVLLNALEKTINSKEKVELTYYCKET